LAVAALLRTFGGARDANAVDVNTAAAFKSKPQAEELIAALNPQPDVAPMIRRISASAPAPSAPDLLAAPEQTSAAPVQTSATVTPPGPRSEVKPLAPERFKIQFTIGRETREKLQTAQDLLRHSVRNGDLAEIFDRALACC
jgi:hypothetical protein